MFSGYPEKNSLFTDQLTQLLTTFMVSVIEAF